MKKLLSRYLIIALLLNETFAMSQEQKFRFVNPTHQYEFLIDTSIWKKASDVKVKAKEDHDRRLFDKDFNYEYIFSADADYEFATPFLLIQAMPTPRNYYQEMKGEFDKKSMETVLTNNSKFFDNVSRTLQFNTTLYDDSLKRISYFITMKDAMGLETVSETTLFFSDNLTVQLLFTTDKSSFALDYFLFKNILDSFKWVSISKKLKIKSLGTLDLPNELEVKGVNPSLLIDTTYSKLILQQKGLNALAQDALSTYVRIMIAVEDNVGKGETFFKTRPSWTSSDLVEFEKYLKREIQNGLLAETKMTSWDGVSICEIDDYYGLLTTFKRQFRTEPQVIVKSYFIDNHDKSYTITTSYREKEASKWQPIVEKVLESIEITYRH